MAKARMTYLSATSTPSTGWPWVRPTGAGSRPEDGETSQEDMWHDQDCST